MNFTLDSYIGIEEVSVALQSGSTPCYHIEITDPDKAAKRGVKHIVIKRRSDAKVCSLEDQSFNAPFTTYHSLVCIADNGLSKVSKYITSVENLYGPCCS